MHPKQATAPATAQHTENEALQMGFSPDAAKLLGRLDYEANAPITRAPWHVNAILKNRIVGDASAPQFDKLQICNSNATVATVYRRQDARLIAAAPDLLAALQNLLALETRYTGVGLREFDQARAVIARASQP